MSKKRDPMQQAMKSLEKVRRFMAANPTYNLRPRLIRHLVARMHGHNLDNMTAWRT